MRATVSGHSAGTPLSGDGSCILLEGANELVVAEALAAWCAADPSQNENLMFVLSGETGVLNHAFARAGLPRLGVPGNSPHRAVLQVLPLAFAMAWTPPEIDRLLELLLLPGGPIRGRIGRRLANALAQQPGIGGPKWVEAWIEIEKDLSASKADGGLSIDELLQRTRAWIEGDRFDPEDGIPRASARAIADRVRNFATRRYSTTENEIWLELARAATDLDRALAVLGMDKVERLLLEQMIEQALGDRYQ